MAALPLSVRVPATVPLRPETEMLTPFARVVGSMGSLKLRVTGVLAPTVLPLTGVMLTLGAVLSAEAEPPVLKLCASAAMGFPARSHKPDRLTL